MESTPHCTRASCPGERGSRTEQDLVEQILDIARRCGSLPDLDGRTAEEILGCRDDGAIE